MSLTPLDESTVLALDNVPLELPVAGVGSRSLSAFLDYVVVGLLIALLTFGAVALAISTRLRGGFFLALLLVGYFLIDAGYFAAAELLTGGRSFGKRVMGLQVVTRSGGRPGTAALLLRNVVRSVDLLVGVPLMAIDPLARRLGDRLAGTLVVHAQPRAAEELLLRRVPRGWGASEVALLESFLRRLPELDAPRAEALARKLLASIERDDPALLAGAGQGAGPVATLRRALGLEQA